MGCSLSVVSRQRVSEPRGRPSVSGMKGLSADVKAMMLEEDRDLIRLLGAKTVVEVLETGGIGDRKMSIGSNTDHIMTPFSLKPTTGTGDKLDPAAANIGYTCRKGTKTEAVNQDSWFVLRVEGDRPCYIYAVLDGHGRDGHDVSDFVKDNLPKLIVRDPRFMTDHMDQMLSDCFKKMQGLISSADRVQRIRAQLSGTTCTIAIHDILCNKLFVAPAADSTAVLCKRAGEKLIGVPFMCDRNPNLLDEGHTPSHCFGHLLGHNDCGLSCEPDVVVRELSAEDEALLICSDGVWDFVSPDEAVRIVSAYTPDQAMVAVEKLAKEAWDRGIREAGSMSDDVTAICVHLPSLQDTVRPNHLSGGPATTMAGGVAGRAASRGATRQAHARPAPACDVAFCA